MKTALTILASATLLCGCGARMSEEARTVKAQMETIAGHLVEADRKGDRALAMQIMPSATAVVAKLNDKAGIEQTPLQNCRLAAAQLSNGVVAVYQGGRWDGQDRYNASLADCK